MARAGTFKKGDPRINRRGRPKLGLTLAEKFRDALAEKLNGDYSKLDSLIDKVVDMALKGNQQAIEFALARGWGKLIDRVEIKKDDIPDLSKLTNDELAAYEALRRKLDEQDDETGDSDRD